MESKNYFYKSCSSWCAIWDCQIKRKLLEIKGNMHHKHDVKSKDIFSILDMAAGIFFWKFCTIIKAAAKRYILSPQITFSSSLLLLLIRLRLPHPGWDGNLRLKRRKNEGKEKVKWGDKMCLFAYDARFSTKIPAAISMI